MRLATVDSGNGSSTAAVVLEDQVFSVRQLPDREASGDVTSLIRCPLTAAELDTLLTGTAWHINDVTWMPPVPRPPKNVICVGKNYREHVLEGARAEGSNDFSMPVAPRWFSKPPTALTGHRAVVALDPCFSRMVDYEGELTVVIGHRGRARTRQEAMDMVFGYTLLNDVTARDVQQRHGQWFKGKGADGFAPCGPWVTTKDAVDDPHDLTIVTRVNGRIRQEGNTRDMLFDIPELILDLSQGMTLEPGDLIATGTPAGVGWGRDEYLSDGDVVTVSVAGVGELQSTFREPDATSVVRQDQPPYTT